MYRAGNQEFWFGHIKYEKPVFDNPVDQVGR